MSITRTEIMSDIPEKEILLLADALFFAIYGWTPERVKRIRLTSISRWITYAKKRMTWGDALKLRAILEPKRVSLWKKIISRIKF